MREGFRPGGLLQAIRLMHAPLKVRKCPPGTAKDPGGHLQVKREKLRFKF